MRVATEEFLFEAFTKLVIETIEYKTNNFPGPGPQRNYARIFTNSKCPLNIETLSPADVD